MEKILVTSALPYANGPIHIGHIAGAYLPADIYVRFNKLMGRDVLYICGTDEHGVPITIRAEQEGISPQDVVDRYHQEIKSSFDSLQIEFDNFSRTSFSEHYKISQGFFKELLANGYIETNVEKQLFCEDNQKFLPDRYIEGTCPHCGYERARGDECPKCGKWLEATELKNPSSKLCKTPLVIKETQHWYLRLDKLQGKLESWLEQKDWKDNVKNFVLGWFKDGLKPRPITRDLSWGIPVPLDLSEAKNKVLYVWFDAPIGYLSSTVEWAAKKGTPDAWKSYWQESSTKLVHFIGKDNIPFHAIVWPAMLMGQTTGYILPSEIPANEHLTVEGEKISTSRGNAVWIPEFLEDFPSDYLRYYLAVNAPENKDADFSWKNFQNVINAELINIVANLFNRVLSFTFSRYNQEVPHFQESKANGYDEQILDQIKTTLRKAKKLYAEFCVRDVTREILDLARAGNQYFQDNEPWKMVKTDEERVAVVLNVCIRLIEALAVLYYPIIPGSSKAMWEALNMPFPLENSRLEMMEEMGDPGGRSIRQPMPLFAKVEDQVVNKHLERLASRVALSNENTALEQVALIDIVDFKKVILKTGKILEAQKVEKSKKLIQMKVKIGAETRQILGGLSPFYQPADLVGKTVAVVFNLKPAKLMGLESQGMLLAAKMGDKLFLLTPEGEIEDGSEIS